MRRIRLILVLALCLALTACAAQTAQVPEATLIPGTDPVLPAAADTDILRVREDATLWFRFQDEPFLAPETRTIVQLNGQSYEEALLTSLFAGPGTQYVELRSAFPQGVRVAAVTRQGRTLLVTLSREFLNGLGDEPANWREDRAWSLEMPLRRRLAMQSLVATVTENCDVDEVIVLLEQDEDLKASMWLEQSWFLDGSEGNEPAPPQTRDDSCLLTPSVTGEAILTCWLQRDWKRLYRYVSPADAYSGEKRPEYADFVTLMESLPVLTNFSAMGWSVSRDGLETTLSVQVAIRSADGGSRQMDARILRLRRDSGLWRIGISSLTDWLEV